MQYTNKEFDPEKHDKFRALTVKQPYASDLVTAIYENESGVKFGLKSIEVRSKPTKYRGDILICSSSKPELPGYESGVTLGFVEIYDIKKVEDFTPEDWEKTRIPKETREKINTGFGWLTRNPRRVIEFPVKGQLGIYNLVYSKGVIMQYPEVMVFGKDDLDLLLKKNEKNRS